MAITDLQTLTESEFYTNLRIFLEVQEGNEPAPYYDTAGHATIGIGFNLDDADVRNDVYTAMGISGAMAANLDDVLDTQYDSKEELQAELKKVYGQPFSMTTDQINAVFVILAKQHTAQVKPSSGVDFSSELIALVSLHFNSPTLYGPGVRAGLHMTDPNDARAETWYQIRYVHVAGQNESRRNAEADLFNLYGQGRGQSMTEEVARATYRMYTRHEVAMKGRDGELVLSAQLQPAATYLINQYGEKKSFDALNIFVSESNDSAVLGGYGIDGGYIDRSTDTKDILLIGGDKADIFHGGTGNDVLQGGDGLNILYGEGGDDTLIGGKDDDILTGGAGNDTLKGGDGTDTYIYASGDGTDTIYDYIGDGFGGDGHGSIQYDGTGLHGGINGKEGDIVEKSTKGGTYKSSDEKYTYTWGGEGSDLTINGTITVKNFKNGDLGITLYDRKTRIDQITETVASWMSTASRAVHVFFSYDPLTLDLNGDGINTVPRATPPLFFDLTATGIKTSTGWIAPDDGLLVMDRNGNGTIDNGAELFGDATPAYAAGTTNPTTGRTADGFAALAQEDTNHDGVVDAQDANWSDLRVWQDLNQDGISQSNELATLDEQGIASFNVARTVHSQMLPSGNQMSDLGTFTRTDGSTGNTGAPQAMADINLSADTFHRTFTDTIPLTAQAETLPDMQGSGKVRDLQQAASLQTVAGQTLSTVLANYSSAGTREEQLAQIDELLAAWADSSGFGTLQSWAAAYEVANDFKWRAQA
jgi:hypothetical protein